MNWRTAARYWERAGRADPMAVILTGPDFQPARWDHAEFFAAGRADVENLMAKLRALAPHMPRRSAIDFGCGVGRISRALARHFDRVIGIDVAASMIDRARALNRDEPRCTFAVNRSRRLRGIRDDSFDLVYSRLVLQHIPPPAATVYLRELVRVLAPGGVLMFQLPEPLGLDLRALYRAERQAFLQAPIADTRLKRITPKPLIRLYRRLRFRLITLERRPHDHMQMFGLSRAAVLDVASRAGARLLGLDADDSHGTPTPGYVYWMTK